MALILKALYNNCNIRELGGPVDPYLRLNYTRATARRFTWIHCANLIWTISPEQSYDTCTRIQCAIFDLNHLASKEMLPYSASRVISTIYHSKFKWTLLGKGAIPFTMQSFPSLHHFSPASICLQLLLCLCYADKIYIKWYIRSWLWKRIGLISRTFGRSFP